jgi:hypothetical protein
MLLHNLSSFPDLFRRKRKSPPNDVKGKEHSECYSLGVCGEKNFLEGRLVQKKGRVILAVGEKRGELYLFSIM